VRSERGLDRFVTFLDAVVAIAITLLVLPLVELLHGSDPQTSLSRLLTEEAGTFGAFLLSFAVIARLWLAHHRLVERVGGCCVAEPTRQRRGRGRRSRPPGCCSWRSCWAR
jgi:uncharacterized membrane protein